MYLSSRNWHFNCVKNVFLPTYCICVLTAVNRSVRWLDVLKKTAFGFTVCRLRILFFPSSIMALRPYKLFYIMEARKTLPEGKDSENLNLLTNYHLVLAPRLSEHAWWLLACTWRRIYMQWLKYINRPCGWSKVSECYEYLWVLCHWCLIYVSGVSIKVRADRERERERYITFRYLYRVFLKYTALLLVHVLCIKSATDFPSIFRFPCGKQSTWKSAEQTPLLQFYSTPSSVIFRRVVTPHSEWRDLFSGQIVLLC